MRKKEEKRIDIKRMVEIEQLRFSQYIKLEDVELEYLNFAMKMPIEEIREFLNLYDNTSPKLDEIKFIISIQNKYSETRENVLRRIRQVRQITQYEKAFKEGKNFLKRNL